MIGLCQLEFESSLFGFGEVMERSAMSVSVYRGHLGVLGIISWLVKVWVYDLSCLLYYLWMHYLWMRVCKCGCIIFANLFTAEGVSIGFVSSSWAGVDVVINELTYPPQQGLRQTSGGDEPLNRILCHVGMLTDLLAVYMFVLVISRGNSVVLS